MACFYQAYREAWGSLQQAIRRAKKPIRKRRRSGTNSRPLSIPICASLLGGVEKSSPHATDALDLQFLEGVADTPFSREKEEARPLGSPRLTEG